MTKAPLVFVLALSMAATTSSAISSQAFAQTDIEGPAGNTCAQFAQDYKVNPKFWELMYFTWAMGFMSGLNIGDAVATGESIKFGSKSLDEQKQYLRTYCDEHPLASYQEAVFSLFKTFAK